MFTIDAHLDLSMNAMEWNRDLRLTVGEIRERDFRRRAAGDLGLLFEQPLREEDLGEHGSGLGQRQ